MCVCLVFQLRHILFLAIKINIHVAIFIQYTKHALMYIYIYIYINQRVCMFSLSITTYFIPNNKNYYSCCNSHSMYQTCT